MTKEIVSERKLIITRKAAKAIKALSKDITKIVLDSDITFRVKTLRDVLPLIEGTEKTITILHMGMELDKFREELMEKGFKNFSLEAEKIKDFKGFLVKTKATAGTGTATETETTIA